MKVTANKGDRDAIIDKCEEIIIGGKPITCPLTHRFTDGMYSREIFMEKGTVLTSRVHKTNHPFVVSKGKCKVFDGHSIMEIEAPYTGITESNTRRLLYIEEDTIWTTFHVTDLKDVKEIEEEILVDYKNELLDQDQFFAFNNECTKENIIVENIKKIKGGK